MQHLPFMSSGFDDPRVTVMYQDGDAFAGSMKDRFDVIIVDSSDPVGPADVLFQQPFYNKCYGALKEGGILACQGPIALSSCCWNDIATSLSSLACLSVYYSI